MEGRFEALSFERSCGLTRRLLEFSRHPEEMKALGRALQKGGSKLVGCGLGDNRVSDRGLQALAAACSTGGTELKELHLFNNKIGDPGMVALAAALESGNCGLTVVDLSRKHFAGTPFIAVTRPPFSLF